MPKLFNCLRVFSCFEKKEPFDSQARHAVARFFEIDPAHLLYCGTGFMRGELAYQFLMGKEPDTIQAIKNISKRSDSLLAESVCVRPGQYVLSTSSQELNATSVAVSKLLLIKKNFMRDLLEVDPLSLSMPEMPDTPEKTVIEYSRTSR